MASKQQKNKPVAAGNINVFSLYHKVWSLNPAPPFEKESSGSKGEMRFFYNTKIAQ